jgi:hypothetical protein
MSTTTSQSTPTVPATAQTDLYANFITTAVNDNVELQKQQIAIHALEKEFGLECIQKHRPWTWIAKKGGQWIPYYKFASIDSLTRETAYDEYTIGLNGHFSITALNAKWGPKWRANQSNESSRRNKFYALVDELLKERRWDREKVFGFLNAIAPISSNSDNENFTTLSNWIRYLPMNKGRYYNELIELSRTFYK